MKIDHHRGPVVYVAISSTSEVLVSGSNDATICLWSLETYELLNLMQFNSPVLNFRLSPDSVSITKKILYHIQYFLWIFHSFFIHVFLLNYLMACCSHLQVFLLAHCEDNGLYLRTLATGTELHQLKGHKSKVNKEKRNLCHSRISLKCLIFNFNPSSTSVSCGYRITALCQCHLATAYNCHCHVVYARVNHFQNI